MKLLTILKWPFKKIGQLFEEYPVGHPIVFSLVSVGLAINYFAQGSIFPGCIWVLNIFLFSYTAKLAYQTKKILESRRSIKQL